MAARPGILAPPIQCGLAPATRPRLTKRFIEWGVSQRQGHERQVSDDSAGKPAPPRGPRSLELTLLANNLGLEVEPPGLASG